jgi:hypothetical protein
MMDHLWTLCRFLGSVASYYITPIPPDFELVRAEGSGKKGADLSEKRDLTPQMLVWLAYYPNGGERPWDDDERLLLYYKHKGAGPFIIYFDAGDTFSYPPVVEEVKPVEFCIVSAELQRGEDVVDLTEEAATFSGPDGRWHGRLKQGTFDVRLLYSDIKEGETVVLSFADGGDVELSLPSPSSI